MMHSRLAEMKKLCGLIEDHWIEILNCFDFKFTNAILEGMNSIIQNVKRRARGFRNTEYFKTMIYLNCSDLDIDAVISTKWSEAPLINLCHTATLLGRNQ